MGDFWAFFWGSSESAVDTFDLSLKHNNLHIIFIKYNSAVSKLPFLSDFWIFVTIFGGFSYVKKTRSFDPFETTIFWFNSVCFK